MRIKDYEDKKREIKSHFKEYLKLKGRTVGGNGYLKVEYVESMTG